MQHTTNKNNISNYISIDWSGYPLKSNVDYIQLMKNVGIDCRANTDAAFQFKCAALQAMTINQSGVTFKGLTVVEKATVRNLKVDNDILRQNSLVLMLHQNH